MTAVAIGISLVFSFLALAVSALTFWLEWRKPFGLVATIHGQVVYPPFHTATSFSLIVPVVFRNTGARPGSVDAAYIRMLHTSTGREYRLEAFATVDTVRAIQLVHVINGPEGAEAIYSFSGFVQLGKYEAREIGILFKFPPEDAKRYTMFADPKEIVLGDYRLELWCLVEGKWQLYAENPIFTLRAEQVKGAIEGRPSLNLYGGIYDTAPGAPLGPQLKEHEAS